MGASDGQDRVREWLAEEGPRWHRASVTSTIPQDLVHAMTGWGLKAIVPKLPLRDQMHLRARRWPVMAYAVLVDGTEITVPLEEPV